MPLTPEQDAAALEALRALGPEEVARRLEAQRAVQAQVEVERKRVRWQGIRPFCFEALSGHFDASLGLAPFHEGAFGLIEGLPTATGPVNAAMAAPRGGGKSTLLFMGLPAHMALHPELYGIRYIMLGRAKYALAEKEVAALRDELAQNHEIRAVYGDQRTDTWNRGRFITASGVLVEAFGLDQHFRGAVWRTPEYGSVRPGFVGVDDPDRDAGSPAARLKLREVFRGAVGGLTGPEGDVDDSGHIMHTMVAGTVLDAHCLIAWLLSDEAPAFSGERYPAVLQWPDEMAGKWAEWRERYRDDPTPDKSEALAFYRRNREDMDAGAEVAWAGDPLYRQMVFIEKSGQTAHAKEKQGDTRGGEDKMVQASQLSWWAEEEGWTPREGVLVEDVPTAWGLTGVSFDPALGKKKGDYATAIGGSVVGGRIWLRAYDMWRGSGAGQVDRRIIGDQLVRRAVDVVQTVAPAEFLRAEVVGAFELLTGPLLDELRRRGLTTGLEEWWPGQKDRTGRAPPAADKQARLARLQPLLMSGVIVLHRSMEGLPLDQILALREDGSSVDHDDFPDALEMLVSRLRQTEVTMPAPPRQARQQHRGIGDFTGGIEGFDGGGRQSAGKRWAEF